MLLKKLVTFDQNPPPDEEPDELLRAGLAVAMGAVELAVLVDKPPLFKLMPPLLVPPELNDGIAA